MKEEFSLFDQTKINEPILKPRIPEKQLIANVQLLMVSSWKTSCYLLKIKLKSKSKDEPADGVVHVQSKCERGKCFTYWEMTNITGTVKVFRKKMNIFKTTHSLPLCFMLWNGSGKPIQHVISFWLWLRKSYLDCILTEPEESPRPETLKALLQRFCYEKQTKSSLTKMIFMLLFTK